MSLYSPSSSPSRANGGFSFSRSYSRSISSSKKDGRPISGSFEGRPISGSFEMRPLSGSFDGRPKSCSFDWRQLASLEGLDSASQLSESRPVLRYSSSACLDCITGSGNSYGGLYNRPSSRPNFGPRSFRPVSYGSYYYTTNTYAPLTTTDNKPHVTSGSCDLRVNDVELFRYDNRKAHYTEEYEDPSLIVRRGQDILLTVKFSRPIDLEKDRIVFQFTVGSHPKKSKGTLVQARKVDKCDPKEWGYKVQQHSGADLTVSVQASAEAVVGAYTCFINMHYTDEDGKPQTRRHKLKEKVTMLFNPWCKDDQVYLEDADERFEYVMNETGRVYVGSSKRIFGRPWNFGQFEQASLEAALYLLEKSYLNTKSHGNPTRVTRALSALVNSSDRDSGVLEGNWSGNYLGGKPPNSWNGSVAILEEYLLNKKPVKYGQCWVFSGVTTTVCRALGIPARSVTNFQSAHDSDCSMTIDEHRDQDGRPLSDYNDSIWNFHVWNEGWFRRPDLPDGNDGWQAFDATPQESSEGMYRCGPAPVAAIKEGNVYFGYDAPFIFAEVNGDYIIWMVDSSGEITPVNAIQNHVGSQISTKAVGSNDRADVTLCYKYPEGSPEERHVTQKAWRYSTRRSELAAILDQLANFDCKFHLGGDVQNNGDICVKLNVTNNSSENRNIEIRMYANAKYYTGIPGEEIDYYKNEITIGGNQSQQVEWDMSVVDYLNRLDEDATLGIYAMTRVRETRQCFSAQETFDIDKPDLLLTVLGSPKKGEPFAVEISFMNPLAARLTSCRLFLEGPGIQKELTVPTKKTLNPGEKMTERVTLTPRIVGRREIIANLHSQQLTGITGVVEVNVSS